MILEISFHELDIKLPKLFDILMIKLDIRRRITEMGGQLQLTQQRNGTLTVRRQEFEYDDDDDDERNIFETNRNSSSSSGSLERCKYIFSSNNVICTYNYLKRLFHTFNITIKVVIIIVY